jgi:AraC-like DNA-binding protein
MDHVPLKMFSLTEEASVFFERTFEKVEVPEHDHAFYEITIVLEGEARHQAGNQLNEAQQGDVFIVPVGASHAWLRPSNLHLLNIYYRSERLLPVIGGPEACLFFSSDFFDNPAMKPVVNFRVAKETLSLIQHELNSIQILHEVSPTASRTFHAGCFLKILSILGFEYSNFYSGTEIHRSLHPAVYRLLELLNHQASIGEVPKIGQHASRLGMSSEHLSRIFMEEVGIPPFKYFAKRRLTHAKDLLLKNVYTNTEVAFRLGFADSAHFCRVFKDAFHSTPTEFKQQFHPILQKSETKISAKPKTRPGSLQHK